MFINECKVLGFDFKHLTAKLEQAVVFEPS